MLPVEFKTLTKEQAALFMSAHQIQSVRSYVAEKIGAGSVIDIGCGPGFEVSKLYTPEQYIGIDVSLELIKLAKKANPGYRFSPVGIDLVRGHYEFGVMKAVLEHVHPNEALRIFEAARRVCDTLYVIWHTPPKYKETEIKIVQAEFPIYQNHYKTGFFGEHASEDYDKWQIWSVRGLLSD